MKYKEVRKKTSLILIYNLNMLFSNSTALPFYMFYLFCTFHGMDVVVHEKKRNKLEKNKENRDK